MNLLFDTNIILNTVRAVDDSGITYFLNPQNFPVYISVASKGEIRSIALQRIASLAALLDLQPVTTDADFDHLHNVFFDVRKIKQHEFLPFFKK